MVGVNMSKVGYAEGTCSRCGRTHKRRRPADYAVCDCFRHCPIDHGRGTYGTLMDPYTPDMNPLTYGKIKRGSSVIWGDTEHPMWILYVCSVCSYHSKAKPVEVKLR